MIRFSSLLLMLTLVASVFASDQQQDIKPTMRAVDRDWEYFKSVPCEKLTEIVFHSRSEEKLLAKRKQQCVDQYKAFLPVPIDR